MSVFLVTPNAGLPAASVQQSEPAERIGMGVGTMEVHDLKPGNAHEVAAAILQRIPGTLIAVLDATRICDTTRECVLIQLQAKEAAATGYEVTTERCVPLETPRSFGRRIREIEDPAERASFVRAAALYKDTESARHFAEGIREAMEKEKDPEVLRAMEEVLRQLEAP